MLTTGLILHLRFEGRSEELNLDALNLSRDSSDEQIKQAVATHFDRPARNFENYVVVRNHEAIIVRPEAIYG
ncbi:MAG: hypothetical protein WCS37_00525 [Chloroflexota bacterium]|nr:hypothetical protein [Chloroflexota bacterium]